MDMEAQVREAIVDELRRQADAGESGLSVQGGEDGFLAVQGSIDLEALAMAVVGSVAGGP